MSDLIVIVPSRGRPAAARALVETFRNTCSANVFLAFAVDQDDPERVEYETVGDGKTSGVLFTPSQNMGEALNAVALLFLSQEPFAIAFMGDDHCPRTYGWDTEYLKALRELGTGIVYGNDLLQGENLPTQVAMTSDIIRALGYMAPPALVHLYLDNFWKVLGNGAECLRYLPDVIVEHRHPLVGKAEWDEGYQRVNAPAVYEHDKTVFEEWLRTSMVSDVAKVRALR